MHLLLCGFTPKMHFSKLEIPCEQFVLDNGLTVVVHEDHKAPIVALNIWYHVGSKNEKPGKTGFAHLFEHLMFGGSEHLPGSYIEAMERIGATDLNGTTNEDRTNYFENVPVSALDYALFAESDRMGHFYNTISQEVLDLQRGVVKNEKQQGDNQPYSIVEDLMVNSTYPAEHPYAHTVIGSMEDLDSATIDDVREWFKTYYTPSNAVLVLAGDITAEQAREKVTRYFGEIEPGPPVAHQRSWIAKMRGEHGKRWKTACRKRVFIRLGMCRGMGRRRRIICGLRVRCFRAGRVRGCISGWFMTTRLRRKWPRIWMSAKLAGSLCWSRRRSKVWICAR